MSTSLLIEIGTEELPSSFVAHALSQLPKAAEELLRNARLGHGAVHAYGTPRRLAVLVESVEEAQADLSDEVHGPPTRIALDANGKPTKAALGFAKKQGCTADDLFVASTDKGEYVAVRREEPGQPAAGILPTVVSTLCGRISFPKSMRWGAGEIAFGRPVHWLVALHGERVIDAQFADVQADRRTRGHRFLSPGVFDLPNADDYVARLRQAHVVVDVPERQGEMERALAAAAAEMGGTLVDDAFLLEECASLVEEPHVVPGSFDAGFLDLPDDVIVSVMRDHQRYFAVRDKDGALMPRYLNVVNTANAPALIAKGNDRVLRARLADARFFVDEDRKVALQDRIARLDGVVFQAKLGTVGAKVRRMSELAGSLVQGADTELAREAATLCKADLVTLIVGEFPELQGEMGTFYALQEGVEPRVAEAIAAHYRPKGAGDVVPQDAIGAAVGVADRVDTLVGCFGIGLLPTGSADPFALRRAALGIVRIALQGPTDVVLEETLARAYGLYPLDVLSDQAAVVAKLDEFFRARLRAYYGEEFPHDVIEACLGAWQLTSLRDLDARVRAIDAFRAMPEYESLAVAFKRAHNIAKDVPAGNVDAALLQDPAEQSLAERFGAIRPVIEQKVTEGQYESALSMVAAELREPIDRFFEEVFVMVEDESLRENRLQLVGGIARTLTSIAHFHKLSA